MAADTDTGSWAKAPGWDERSPERARLAAATLADRHAYLESGLRPVTCQACRNEVLVRKTSLAQTSIQWTTEAVRCCPEFAAYAATGRPTALLAGCHALRDSIDAAARDGVWRFDDD